MTRDSDTAPKRTRKDVLRDIRRAQIVDAARAVIGELGYTEASVDLIADRAGISKSTLYVYFESKEAILAGCFAAGQEELVARLAAALASTQGVEAKLVALVGCTLEHFDAHRVFFGAVLSQAYLEGTDRAEGSHALASLSKAFGPALTSVLEEGLASGELRPHDVRESAIFFGTLVYGALALRSRQAIPAGPPFEDAALLCRHALHGLLAK